MVSCVAKPSFQPQPSDGLKRRDRTFLEIFGDVLILLYQASNLLQRRKVVQDTRLIVDKSKSNLVNEQIGPLAKDSGQTRSLRQQVEKPPRTYHVSEFPTQYPSSPPYMQTSLAVWSRPLIASSFKNLSKASFCGAKNQIQSQK